MAQPRLWMAQPWLLMAQPQGFEPDRMVKLRSANNRTRTVTGDHIASIEAKAHLVVVGRDTLSNLAGNAGVPCALCNCCKLAWNY